MKVVSLKHALCLINTLTEKHLKNICGNATSLRLTGLPNQAGIRRFKSCLEGRGGGQQTEGYTTSIIHKSLREKKNHSKSSLCINNQNDTERGKIRTNGEILGSIINHIHQINHSSASEQTRKAERQKTRLSLSLSPHPTCKSVLSNFWSSRRSVIDLETRVSDYIMMQMCFPARLAAAQLPLQQMSSEYE